MHSPLPLVEGWQLLEEPAPGPAPCPAPSAAQRAAARGAEDSSPGTLLLCSAAPTAPGKSAFSVSSAWRTAAAGSSESASAEQGFNLR